MPSGSDYEGKTDAQKNNLNLDKIDKITEERSRSEDIEEEEEDKGNPISKTIALIVALILIIASIGIFLTWDYSGDGLANHRQMALIGDVEGDWTEYDSSGDGLSDGTTYELGLNPAEQHSSVSAAYEGGLRGDNALPFQDLEVNESRLEKLASYMAEMDNKTYIEDAVEYLSENPDHIDALVNETGSVQEHAFKHMEELPPEVLRVLSPFASEYVDGFELEILKDLSRLKDTSTNRSLAENISKIPSDLHDDLIDYALENTSDTDHLYDVRDQARFLKIFEDKGKLDEYLSKHDAADYDVSEDGFTNWFSLQQSDIIKWDEANDRYVIGFEKVDYGQVPLLEGFAEDMEIDNNRTWTYSDDNATLERLDNITDKLEGKLDENDILMAYFGGHGWSGGIGGLGTFDEMDEELDLPGYQLVMVSSCHSGGAISDMKAEDRVVLTSSDSDQKTIIPRFTRDFFDYIRTEEQRVVVIDDRVENREFNHSPDLNGTGYVSVGEAYDSAIGLHVTYGMTTEEYVQDLIDGGYLEEVDNPETLYLTDEALEVLVEDGYIDPEAQHPQASDPSDIADDLFMGQYRPETVSRNRAGHPRSTDR